MPVEEGADADALDEALEGAGLRDLAALALPPEGPLVLLGESFSGPIAISLAAANPKRVVGVVLCCTFVRNPRPGLRWLSGLASIPAPLPPSSILSSMLFGRFATPRLSRMLRDALAQVQPTILRARLRAVVSVDVRAQARPLPQNCAMKPAKPGAQIRSARAHLARAILHPRNRPARGMHRRSRRTLVPPPP